MGHAYLIAFPAHAGIDRKEAMALRTRYIALYDVQDAERPALSVFEFSPKRWWTGITVFVPEDLASGQSWREYIEKQRSGYRRWPK